MSKLQNFQSSDIDSNQTAFDPKNSNQDYFFQSNLKEPNLDSPNQSDNLRQKYSKKSPKLHCYKKNQIFRLYTIFPNLSMKILNINSKREDSLQLDPEAENSSNRNKLLQNKTKFISFGKSACIVSDKFNSISIIPYQSNCIEIVIDFHERITMILAPFNSDPFP